MVCGSTRKSVPNAFHRERAAVYQYRISACAHTKPLEHIGNLIDNVVRDWSAMGRVRRGDGMKTQNLTQKNTVWKYMRHCNEVRSCLVLMKGISFGCETSKVLWPCVPYQSYRSVVRYWSFRQNGKKSEICKLRWLAG